MRKRCGLTRYRSNGHCKVWSLNHRVKCDKCSKNSDEYKQSDWIKACNHTLLDFLHLSRNRYLYLHCRASKVGMLHWTWWILTLALQGKLYRDICYSVVFLHDIGLIIITKQDMQKYFIINQPFLCYYAQSWTFKTIKFLKEIKARWGPKQP